MFAQPALAGAQTDPETQPGFQAHHDYLSWLPFEQIDPGSGSLLLTFTDLSLPGNAGLNLTWTRTYNSKTEAWTYGLAGVPMRVVHAQSPEQLSWPQQFAPELFTADGGRHATFSDGTPDADTWMSAEFWKYSRAAHTVALPNGVVATYDVLDASDSSADRPYGANTRYVTHVQDAFGNAMDVAYVDDTFPPLIDHVTQHVANGGDRVLTFTYDGNALQQGYGPRALHAMTYAGRTWSYNPNLATLTSVDQPAGGSWQFSLSANFDAVTLPAGGRVEYTLVSNTYYHGERPSNTRTVSQRQTFERGGAIAGT